MTEVANARPTRTVSPDMFRLPAFGSSGAIILPKTLEHNRPALKPYAAVNNARLWTVSRFIAQAPARS
jgi:hypothetical protein